jgi:hypothetical protein
MKVKPLNIVATGNTSEAINKLWFNGTTTMQMDITQTPYILNMLLQIVRYYS